MKKTLAIIMVTFLGIGCALANENKIVKREYNIVTEGAKTCDGILKQVLPLDYSRTNPVIIVQGVNDAAAEFVVRPSAAVFNGSDGKLISLKDVPLGSPLQVTYDVVDGVSKASGIKVLSDAGAVKAASANAPAVAPSAPVVSPKVAQDMDEDKDIK